MALRTFLSSNHCNCTYIEYVFLDDSVSNDTDEKVEECGEHILHSTCKQSHGVSGVCNCKHKHTLTYTNYLDTTTKTQLTIKSLASSVFITLPGHLNSPQYMNHCRVWYK